MTAQLFIGFLINLFYILTLTQLNLQSNGAYYVDSRWCSLLYIMYFNYELSTIRYLIVIARVRLSFTVFNNDLLQNTDHYCDTKSLFARMN